MCSIPWLLQFSLNWAEVNCVPLSDTIVSGRPWVANILSRTLIVAEALVDDIVIISGHFECESTKIGLVTTFIGPAKSICTRLYGFFVSAQGIRFSRGGPFAANWHLRQSLTNPSMSFSMPSK